MKRFPIPIMPTAQHTLGEQMSPTKKWHKCARTRHKLAKSQQKYAAWGTIEDSFLLRSTCEQTSHETKDTMKHAVFDHVDDEGNLILSLDGEKVDLSVTDELEHGILSAKQIKSETQAANLPPEPATLPISSIQTLVREGHTTTEIAQKYSVAESLVRRFAQPVETEKHYAIAQFLSVNTQTGAATRKLEDVIVHNLNESGVDPKSVVWEATKQGRDPWKIVAHFERREQEYKGTWMWNLRDNSVVSIDPVAKRLLGENASAGTLLFGEEPANTSSRSIQAALNGRGPIPPAWLNDNEDDNEDDASPSALDENSEETSETDTQVPRAAENASTAEETRTAGTSSDPAPFPSASVTNEEPGEPEEPTSTEPQRQHPAQPQPEKAAADPTPQNEGAEHKKRRAAVPSWDDILFGD
jgi:hypothetical protein